MSFNPTSDSRTKIASDEAEESNGAAALELAAPLRWNVNLETEPNLESADETSTDEEDAPLRKKRKRKHDIQHDLTTDLQTRTPQSSADFERLLLGSPNSSYLWVQFMAFQLQLSEVDKAREVGRRALKAINFREEQERLNVWIALLNLEVTYGTSALLETVFKEAARANDSKTIHLRLAILLDDSQKYEV
jgi:rRNA biogenesis protein RRP5